MEPNVLQDIRKTLDRIAKILAGILLKDIEDSDQIKRMARLKQCGFQNTEIAQMLGTTPNTVNVQLHALRKRKKARKSKTRK